MKQKLRIKGSPPHITITISVSSLGNQEHITNIDSSKIPKKVTSWNTESCRDDHPQVK